MWFFNLPSATIGEPPSAEDLPPQAVTRLTMRGTILARTPGVLQVRTSPSVDAGLSVDGQQASIDGVQLAAGAHDIVINATLTDTGWTLAPLWNDADLLPRCRRWSHRRQR